jgi:hypothetical protein
VSKKLSGEVVQLANGFDVPVEAVRALDDFAERWPGSTFQGARAGVVYEVLKSIGWFDGE